MNPELVRKFLVYSFTDVDFVYDKLTTKERALCSEKEFKELVQWVKEPEKQEDRVTRNKNFKENPMTITDRILFITARNYGWLLVCEGTAVNKALKEEPSDVEEFVGALAAEDLGVRVWEGTWADEAKGETRKLTDKEWNLLRDGLPPWSNKTPSATVIFETYRQSEGDNKAAPLPESTPDDSRPPAWLTEVHSLRHLLLLGQRSDVELGVQSPADHDRPILMALDEGYASRDIEGNKKQRGGKR